MKKNYTNSRKIAFLKSIPEASIEAQDDQLTKRCKFNFHYLDFSQPVGQKFEDWNVGQLVKLLNKLKEYSGQPLEYWTHQSQRVGKRSHNVLEIYDNFPIKSEFVHPKHVPHQVRWGRFRMGNYVRIIGFVVPDEFNKKEHNGTKELFDCNTFYVVFLDKDHKFYL